MTKLLDFENIIPPSWILHFCKISGGLFLFSCIYAGFFRSKTSSSYIQTAKEIAGKNNEGEMPITIFEAVKSQVTLKMAAAQKLAADFGIREAKPSVMAKLHAYKARADDEKHCSQVLQEYPRILKDW